MLFNYHVKEMFRQCAFSSKNKQNGEEEKKRLWEHGVKITLLSQKLAL